MMTTFTVGDRVSIRRRTCAALARQPGAVWVVDRLGKSDISGSPCVVVRSPAGFTLEVPPDLLGPAIVEVVEDDAIKMVGTNLASVGDRAYHVVPGCVC